MDGHFLLEGISINSDFFVRVRKRRAQDRSVYAIHGDLSTELALQPRKKAVSRGVLDYVPVFILGTAANNLCVYEFCGFVNTSSTVPCSTIFPWYITAT